MNQRHRFRPALEVLEARETPATLVNPTTVAYQDFDGDIVTVKLTLKKPGLTAATAATIFTFDTQFGSGGPQQLQTINLTSLGVGANGLSIKTSAVRGKLGGDGIAALGQIDATGIDLRSVVIDGDLGRIIAGDATTTTPGLKTLTARSLGRFGTSTGAPNLNTVIQGKLGVLNVKTDIVGAFIDVQGGNDGDIGRIALGGSLIGGTAGQLGSIRANSDIGNVTIKGSVIGGGQFESGRIATVVGNIGKVAIGGDLMGGTGNSSGQIFAKGTLAALKITGNVVGGSVGGDNDLHNSGYVEAKRIGSLTIRGSLLAGFDFTIGTFGDNGAIRVVDDIGSANIGNIIGNFTNPVYISARGKAVQTKTDLALGKLNVRGRVEYAQILAGYDPTGGGVNADAQVGSVSVGGDWVASSLVAGALATNADFGDADDAAIVGGNSAIVSKIGKVTIRGQAIGTVGGTDQFGIVAQVIGVLRVSGTKLPTTSGSDDFFIGTSGDFKANEI
ncbi:MAG TPA: hypothetical protein VHR66_26325 [Gemmataceae bacterium]|jgi:hypothetical protein|nr:hypothetical protein [Gemmataceae bacterium]